MGMWDFEAWDNDSAADWFGDLMDETNLRGKWLETISRKDEGHSEKRAAVWLFAQLGRVYIWPIENYDSDLELAIKVGEEITESEWLNEEAPPYIEFLQQSLKESE